MLSASVAQIKKDVPSTSIYNFLKPLQMLHKAENIAAQLAGTQQEKMYTKHNTACLQIRKREVMSVNPLHPELNPICYLLALLGAYHFLHLSRIRVKLLTFRLLMSYIYIWSTHS